MDLFANIIFNAYSLFILLIISLQFSKNYSKESLQNKLYKYMVILIMIMLIVDTLGRFDGKEKDIYVFFNYFGNFMIFLLNLTVPSIWMIYVIHQINPKKNLKKLACFFIVLNILNVVYLIISQFFGLMYHIDSDNIYHRGPLFFIQPIIVAIILLVSSVLTVINRKKIEYKYYFSMVFFSVPPFLCIFLQLYIYGISFILNGVVLSLLFIYLRFQNNNIFTDYLTEVYNRKKLDMYLEEKIRVKNNSFSAIMIDMNNFKYINDTYGHSIGDNVLKKTAEILKSCIENEDFIARYGGDEFCIILNHADKNKLCQTVKKINDSITAYNSENKNPYNIGLSMGYEIYNKKSGMSAQEFERTIDQLMYKNKMETKN